MATLVTGRGSLPLITIVGPTASGKTGLAIKLAKEYGGEIICADSRTVYKDMNIGTAKPTSDEQDAVPHWGLDLAEPGERFTAADFKDYATQKIDEIRERGHVPFLVGGTGLYVDGILLDYKFGGEIDQSLRNTLEKKTVQELVKYCNNNNIELPDNVQNKRYVIRAIEQKGINRKSNNTVISNTIVVGIATNRDVLHQRIEQRTEQIFSNGVVEEAILLGKKYGWESEAMTANIYPLLRKYINNQISLDEAKMQFVRMDVNLAKRQLTWLRRRDFICWLPLSEAYTYLSECLAIE